jgi:hypothetical protein
MLLPTNYVRTKGEIALAIISSAHTVYGSEHFFGPHEELLQQVCSL